MGVADGGDPVGTRLGRGRQHACQGRAGGGCGRGDVLQVEGIQGVIERLEDAGPAGTRGRQFRLELEQHVQVEGQFEDLGLHEGDLGTADSVERFAGGRRQVAVARGEEGVTAEDHRVRGRLHVEVDDLPAGSVLRDGDPLVTGVDRLHRLPIGAIHQALGLEAGAGGVESQVEHHLDLPPGPVHGHFSLEPEPGGGPSGPPRRPERVGLVVGRQRLPGSDGFPGKMMGGQGERDRCPVDGRPDPFSEDAAGAIDGERGVGVHGIHPT